MSGVGEGRGAGGGGPAYRADIDGLRAVAVLAVVAFHAGVPGITGGYAGVDVFFVLSGFLIASIIRTEMAAGAFSFAGFWERRARRIGPALVVVTLATAAAAWVIILPRELMEFSQALRGAALMAANIALADITDYFDGPAEMQPLLHLWSLGVEEQFYLVFPLLLWLLTRRAPRLTVPALALLGLASLALGVWGAREAPENAFFLPHMRVWELLAGVLLAVADPPRGARPVREAAAALGLALLIFAFAAYDGETPFPGLPTLAPVAGAALLVWAGAGGAAISRALAWRPLVGVGLISYSLYLWHWPLLVFARHLTPGEVPWSLRAGLAALAFLLAWASWRWIERPFRGARGIWTRRQVFAAAAAASALLFAIGLAGKYTNGAPWRFGPDMRAALEVRVQYFEGEGRHCGHRAKAIADAPTPEAAAAIACTYGPEGAPVFVLWGDSLSMALRPGMKEAADIAGMPGIALAKSACPPVPGYLRRNDSKSRVCEHFNDMAMRVALLPSVRAVILHSHLLPILKSPRGPEFRALFLAHVKTLTEAGKRVILIPSVPDIGFDGPTAIANARRFGRPPPKGPLLAEHLAAVAPYLEMLEESARLPGVEILRPSEAYCDEGRCRVMQEDGTPLYADRLHPGPEGARLLTPMLVDALRRTAGN